MAFLAAIPAAMATLATAATATTEAVAAASLTMAEVGTAVSAIGAGVGAYSSFKQSQYQAAVAKNNSIISANNANTALEQGQAAESASKENTTRTIGREMAAEGANNVDVGFGSPALVREGTQNTGNLDAATIRYNASQTAAGFLQQSAGYSSESSLDTAAGRNALLGGALNIGSSVIGGASSIAGKAAAFQQSGALSSASSSPGG
jgi:hypothetical protein